MAIEHDLIECARHGTTLDLTGRPDDDRTISAVALRQLYLGHRAGAQDAFDPRGPTIVGAIVDGLLDLSHCDVPVPIRLQHCMLGPILAAGLITKTLDLDATTVGSLNLDGADIAHRVNLDGIACAGQVRAVRARIGGQLSMRDATLTSEGTGIVAAALHLDGAAIAGSVFLNGTFASAGQVRAVGARIGDGFNMGGATLTSEGIGVVAAALHLDGADIAGSVFLDEAFACAGQVRAVRARIGQLSMIDATLTSKDDAAALALDGAEISGSVFLSGTFACAGQIRAVGARIGGQLFMGDATLTSEGTGDAAALALDGANITGEVFLNGTFACAGQVRAVRARIGGQLSMTDATLTGEGSGATAPLDVDGAELSGDVFLNGTFTCAGQVRAVRARIGGQLSLSNATLTSKGTGDAAALHLDGAAITGDMFLDGTFACAGQVRALGTRVHGALIDSVEIWPNGCALGGFTYQIDVSESLDTSPWAPAQRIAWLGWMEYSSSAYRHLAAQYRAHGYPDAADDVLIAMRRARRPNLGWFRRRLDWVFEHAVGYGYRPLRLVATMVGVVAFSSLALWALDPVQERLVAPTGVEGFDEFVYTANGEILPPEPPPGGELPPPPRAPGCTASPDTTCFNPLLYSIDTLIPLIDLGQRSTWIPDTTAAGGKVLSWVLAGGRLLGWLFAGAATVVVSRYIQAKET